MPRKSNVAATNEAANREDLRVRSLQAKLGLFKAEYVQSEGKRLAAEQEIKRLQVEIGRLKSAAMPFTTVVGIGALAACLGYRASLIMSWVHDGLPHKIQDGTTTFDLPTVVRWLLARREQRVASDLRDAFHADAVEITSDFDFIADTLTAAIQFVTEELDQTISDGGPGRPDTILDDEHFGPRLARLADLGRRLRESHADVPAPPCTPGKPAFVNLNLGQPWSDEEAR